MNGGFSFDLSIACSELFRVAWGKSLVIAVKSATERNNKTRSCTGAKRMNEARLSHLPFWGPSEVVLFLIKRPSG